MTISTQNSRWEYEGNGVTASFGFDNRIFEAEDLKVYVDGALVEDVYSVSLNADGTGSVVFDGDNIPAAPAVPGEKNVILDRDVPATQNKSFPQVSSFPAEQVAQGFDKLTVLVQQLSARFLRTFALPISETAVDLTLPPLAVRAGKLFGWDALGKPTAFAVVGDGGVVEFPVPVDQGGTGGTTPASARDNLELGSAATKDTGTAAGNVPELDGSGKIPADLLPSAGTGFRNLLINGGFGINQRLPATSADDTYAHDRWYALTQTGTIAVSTLSDVEDGLPRMARLTQSQASAQRMGYAQIIEGRDCRHLRGKEVTFRFRRFRCSAAQAIRFAVLEWTGTEDAVTSDVVNDWTNAAYTAGNFFLGASLAVSGVAAQTPAAATLTDGADLTVTLGSAFNNLIVLAWTEGTAAQNVTLDLGEAQIELGDASTDFERRPFGIELALCRRYYEKTFRMGIVPAQAAMQFAGCVTSVSISGSIAPAATWYFRQPKRAIPTVVTFNPTQANANWRTLADGADATFSLGNASEDAVFLTCSSGTATQQFGIHATADAEL